MTHEELKAKLQKNNEAFAYVVALTIAISKPRPGMEDTLQEAIKDLAESQTRLNLEAFSLRQKSIADAASEVSGGKFHL